MSNVYHMSGHKKVIFNEEVKNITYKEIMTIIIQNATEEGCKKIFTVGGINMCPSEIFREKIDKEQEEYNCSFKDIGCTKCWTRAVKKLRGD